MTNPNPDTTKPGEPKAKQAEKPVDGWHPGTKRVDFSNKKDSA